MVGRIYLEATFDFRMVLLALWNLQLEGYDCLAQSILVVDAHWLAASPYLLLLPSADGSVNPNLGSLISLTSSDSHGHPWYVFFIMRRQSSTPLLA